MNLDEKQQALVLTVAARQIIDAVRDAGGEARVVGGAVRDAVIGRKIGDIDLAGTLQPTRLMEILSKPGIKVVPTGIAHGTVTAVINHIGYEITTLRRDVETDGRHARVEYTDDWKADAARRDFTMNALYLDRNGIVYDYFGGIEDARMGRIRFIGDARARIREDVLRILRFFRFYAWFGKGDPSQEALAACRELASSIPALSAERVAREILKLLAAEDPLAAWRLMVDCKVAQFIAPNGGDVKRLTGLLETEKQFGAAPSALRRLAALWPQNKEMVADCAAKLKLSRRDSDVLVMLSVPFVIPRDGQIRSLIRRAIYKHGVEACRDALLLHGGDIGPALQLIDAWEDPHFPLKGEDIMKLGVEAGPEVGEILRATEEWWVTGDFKADHDSCLTFAADYKKNH